MADRVLSIVTRDVAQHPAVEAWMHAGPNRRMPDHLLVLREARRRSAYRLPGVGLQGGSVIAKRSRFPVALLERTVYEEFLPSLRLGTPRYYGSWFDGPHGWILLEDVSGEAYASGNAEHERLISQWVARLHMSAADIVAKRTLPDAGAARYLDHLVQGRSKIRRALDRFRFPRAEAAVLEAIVAQSQTIEADWGVVEGLCSGVPDTVVHGDIQRKNIFLQKRGDGYDLRMIDWEMAGFGCPAADLKRIDLDVYWSTVRSAWPSLTFDGVKRLAMAGHLFQDLAAVHWLSEWLKHDSERGRSEAVYRLSQLVGRLADAAARVHQK